MLLIEYLSLEYYILKSFYTSVTKLAYHEKQLLKSGVCTAGPALNSEGIGRVLSMPVAVSMGEGGHVAP